VRALAAAIRIVPTVFRSKAPRGWKSAGEACIKRRKNRENKFMRTTILIGAGLVLALAGCGSDTKAEGEAGGDSAPTAAASDAMQVQPGEWEVTSETVNIDSPNMPPQVAEAMKKSIGQKTTSRQCITPEEAAGGDFVSPDPEAQCTKQGFSFAGGRIQGTMSCTGEDGKATVTLNGRHSGTSYDMSARITSENQAGSMTMETRNTGRRIGECPPGSE
jgi:Protein of unknown function (DUF3617)